MFDAIAPRYDLLNRLLSLGIDQRWRRLLVRRLELGAGARVLDHATGTADLALMIARSHPTVHVLGLDPSAEMLRIGVAKVDLEVVQAIALGILCNALVCLAVWLTYSARSTMDKILAIIYPITAFVAAGFEHSVANMYFVPYALFVKDFDPGFVTTVADKIPGLERLTWPAFLVNNLIPVTIGNIIGGAVLVAAVYWAIYLRPEKPG